MFWYCFRERDLVLDLFEMVAGARMHTRYFQAGGLAEDIPRGFYDEARKFCERMPKAVDEYEAILNANKIWLERTVGVGALSAEDAIALGQTGPNLRASGVDWDLRKREPYLAYDEVEFDVPVYEGGDVFDRYKVRVDEMRAVGADHRAVHRPARADAGRALDRGRPQGRAAAARGAAHLDGVADPPLQDRHRGLPRPRGRGLRRRSSRRAASPAARSSRTATAKPWRVKFRAPSFAALHATAACCQDVAVADLIAVVGSLDADHGRRRPVSAWALLTGAASRPAEPASGVASRRSRAFGRRPVPPYCSTSLRHASDAS